MSTSPAQLEPVYRLDLFRVPAVARDEFLGRIAAIHRFLRTLPGSRGDHLLERQEPDGRFRIVTLAIWDSREALARAKDAAQAHYRATGFDPQALLTRLGIEADLGHYSACTLPELN
jgi:heme-degrading monooxygenase HmoA